MTATAEHKTDLCVVGAGPVGMMAALALTSTGRDVTLIGPAAPHDGRTTALWGQSIDFLDHLNCMNMLIERATPITSLRIVDGSKRLIRSPEVRYDSSEINLEAFGYNLKNNDLVEVLSAKVKDEPGLTWLQGSVTSLDIGGEFAVIATDKGDTLQAEMVIGADGQKSIVREAADIHLEKWNYPQTAIVLNFEHTRPHHNISTEFHTETGPFTLVPLFANSSSLVWVETPATVETLLEKPRNELASIIEQKSHFIVGDVKITSDPMTYRLRGSMAREFGKHNAVLIGEAAHAFPPIGAQGMNLGIRDILDLEKVLQKDVKGQTMQQAAVLAAEYSRSRQLDIRARTMGVDLLNRSLLTNFAPTHLSKGIAVYMSDKFPAAKQSLIKFGLGLERKSSITGLRSLLPRFPLT